MSDSGLGDRHQQVVDGATTNYKLDLAAGLTQVLADGTNTYLYGNGRIAQAGSTTEYFLGDALSSVRQLADPSGTVTLTQSYAPYGDVISSVGTSQADYAFTGEAADVSGLTYLRARYYDPQDGRFVSRDSWGGNYNRSLSLNRWGYVEGNPVNFTDPLGLCSLGGWKDSSGLFTQADCDQLEEDLRYGTTSFTESWYRRLAMRERADGLPIAASALDYYLDGSGMERQLPASFVKDTIEVAMPKIKKDIDRLIEWYIDKNFGKLSSCDSLSIGPDIFYGGKYTPNYYAIGLGLNGKQEEVAATLGTFKVYVEISSGLLTKITRGKSYRLNSDLQIRVVIFDWYDWNPGQTVPYPPRLNSNTVKDDWGLNLERNGSASSYLHRGDYIYVDSQTGIKGPGWFFNPNRPPGNWEIASCIGHKVDADGAGPRRKNYCGKKMGN